MSLLVEIAAWSPLAFGVLLLAAQVGAHEFGHWVGGSRGARGEVRAEGVGIVAGAILALVAFVLALTLSFANNRFNERRAGTLAEANAIGTAWLRAQAIDHPRAIEIARLLERYGHVRRDFVRVERDRAVLDELNRQTGALQRQIWGNFAALLHDRPNPVSVSLAAALNETFDRATAERFAFEMKMPAQLFWLLIGMTLLGMGVIGYQLGYHGRPVRILVLLLAATWAFVISDILDLASPRMGALRTSAAAYDWTLEGFKGGITIPPLPDSR